MGDNGVGNHMDGDGQNGEGKLCRDFVRNVCNRGKNCKFIHPENVKIRTDPIFCHDYQQSKCFRGTCKFIHCSREEEDHYKSTGELPACVNSSDYFEDSGRARNGSGGGGNSRKPVVRNNPAPNNNGTNGNGRNAVVRRNNGVSEDIPLCKDYLKGLCDRPPGGCKFRHANTGDSFSNNGGGGTRRRVGNPNYYDSGPEAKRNHYSTDYEDFNSSLTPQYSAPPPPPPPQQGYSTGYSTSYYDNESLNQAAANNSAAVVNAYANNRNGYVSNAHQLTDVASAITSFAAIPANSNTAVALKALEEENFILKRRIEELKKQVSDLGATNEYLLSQNAQLRLHNLKEVQVQGVTAAGPGGGVVQTLVSMAQPIGITPSLSVAATQPLSTITSLPTVSMTPVSVSHSLPVVSMAQHPSQPQTVYPLVTTQGVLPPN